MKMHNEPTKFFIEIIAIKQTKRLKKENQYKKKHKNYNHFKPRLCGTIKMAPNLQVF